MEVCQRAPSGTTVGTFGGANRLIDALPHENFLLNEADHQLVNPKETPGPGAYSSLGVFEQLVTATPAPAPFTTTEPRFHIQDVYSSRSQALPGPGQYGDLNPKVAHISQHPAAPRPAFTTGQRMTDPTCRSPGPKYLPPVHLEGSHAAAPRTIVPKAIRSNAVFGPVGEPVSASAAALISAYGAGELRLPRSPNGRPVSRALSPIRPDHPGPAEYAYSIRAVEQTRGKRAPSWGFGTAPLGRDPLPRFGSPDKARWASPEKPRARSPSAPFRPAPPKQSLSPARSPRSAASRSPLKARLPRSLQADDTHVFGAGTGTTHTTPSSPKPASTVVAAAPSPGAASLEAGGKAVHESMLSGGVADEPGSSSRGASPAARESMDHSMPRSSSGEGGGAEEDASSPVEGGSN